MQLLPPFPPLSQKPALLSPKQVKHGIRITLVEGLIAALFSVFLSGTFFNAFIIQLGANINQLGIIASLTPLSTFIQLIYPWLQRKSCSRRLLLMMIMIPDRFLLWGVIFIPAWLPRPWWIPVLLRVVLVRSLAAQLNNLIYQDWLADLIPIDKRNSYWGLRYTLNGPVGIVIPFLAGFILDRWKGFSGFQILYWVALPLIILDILLFLYQDEPPRQSHGSIGLNHLFSCLRTKQFRNYLVFFFGWTVFQGALTPYTHYVMFKVYHLPYILVSGLTVSATITSTVLYVLWAKIQDKYGAFRVYRYILPSIALISGLWAFVTAQSYWLYFLIFTMTGALNAATLVGGFCLLLNVIPMAERSNFLTMNSVLIGFAGFLAPNLGAGVFQLLSWLRPEFSFIQFSPLQWLFLLGSIVSLLLALTFDKYVKPLEIDK